MVMNSRRFMIPQIKRLKPTTPRKPNMGLCITAKSIGRCRLWVLVVRKRFQQERDASRPQPLSDGQVLSSLAVYSDWIASPVFVGATTVLRAGGRVRPSSPPGAAGRP